MTATLATRNASLFDLSQFRDGPAAIVPPNCYRAVIVEQAATWAPRSNSMLHLPLSSADLAPGSSFQALTKAIWNEAHIENYERGLYTLEQAWTQAAEEQATRDRLSPLPTAEELGLNMQTPAERDEAAALVQAELLGASAAQREKLRSIVTDAATARRDLADAESKLAEYAATLAATRQQLFEAQAPIENTNDDRLRPIWVKAAEQANDNGYCSVYDELSRDIGAPTRDELIANGDLGSDYRVDVELTYSVFVSVTVNAGDENSALDQVRDRDYSDLHEYADVDYSNITDMRVTGAERS